MPTLFYSPGACSLAVHIVLEWIGAPYEAVRVDHHAPEYRQINPAGAVPAFDYGGDRPLTQCSAILMYLAQRHPEANLLDDRSPEAASQVQKWAAFLTGDLHPAFFPLFMPGRYTISKEPAAQADVAAAGAVLVQTKLALLEQQIDGHDWVVGDKRTVIDAYATPMLNWAAAKLPDGLQPFPACKTHRDRMLADPAVRRVMEAEGLRTV